jgi:PIN domain nuclease of toxin-antitoxin system
MIRALADTHALIWYVFADPRLSATAEAIFQAAATSGDRVAISSISLVEIVYLVEKRRIVATTFDQVVAMLNDPQGVLIEAPVDQDVAHAMKTISRAQIPDMPDRIIAATAMHLGVPLISRDGRIKASSLATIW